MDGGIVIRLKLGGQCAFVVPFPTFYDHGHMVSCRPFYRLLIHLVGYNQVILGAEFLGDGIECITAMG